MLQDRKVGVLMTETITEAEDGGNDVRNLNMGSGVLMTTTNGKMFVLTSASNMQKDVKAVKKLVLMLGKHASEGVTEKNAKAVFANDGSSTKGFWLDLTLSQRIWPKSFKNETGQGNDIAMIQIP